MGRKLVAWVHAHRGDGTSQVFGPGDEPPAWAARRITNPKAWEGNDDQDEALSEPLPVAETAAVVARPSVKGKGSGRDTWAAHAEALGVTYPVDASRDEIIAAVDAHQQ